MLLRPDMNRIWTLITPVLAAPTLLFGQLLEQPKILDGFAASVAGNLITITEVQERALRLNMAVPKDLPREQQNREFQINYLKSLNALIDEKLVIAEFEMKGGSIPEQAIKNQMEVVIENRFGGDQAKLLQALEQEQSTLASFKDSVRENIIVASMRNEALPPVSIPPVTVRAKYKADIAEYEVEGGTRFALLMLRGAGKDPAELRIKANEIREAAIGGRDFSALVRIHSAGPNSDEGGDQGYQEEKDLNATFRDALNRLNKGDISHAISLGSDIYLLKLIDRREKGLIPFADVQEQIESVMLEEARKRIEEAWMSRLRKKHSVIVYK